MFAKILNFNQQTVREKESSFLKLLTSNCLSWIREVEGILEFIIVDSVALNILRVSMKDNVGREQWQANPSPGWERGIRR